MMPIQEVAGRVDLYKLLPRGAVGCEIGVSSGWNAHLLFHTTHPKELHLVDPFTWKPDDEEKLNHRFELAYYQEVVKIHKTTDEEFLPQLPDDYFDWLYLDAFKTYEAMKHHIDLALLKIKPGGHLGGHDLVVAPWSWRTGPVRVLFELIQSQRASLIAVSNTHFADWLMVV